MENAWNDTEIAKDMLKYGKKFCYFWGNTMKIKY